MNTRITGTGTFYRTHKVAQFGRVTLRGSRPLDLHLCRPLIMAMAMDICYGKTDSMTLGKAPQAS